MNGRLLDPGMLARLRIRLGWLGGLFFLYLAQPRFRLIFLFGFLAALVGQALRLWAAGTIKKDRELAREGPYGLVRHPLYFGSFLIVAGFCLASFNPYHWLRMLILWAASLGGFAWLYRQKMADEERSLREDFGESYVRYAEATPAFWPDLKRISERRLGPFDWTLALQKNREHHAVLGILGVAAILWMKLIYQL
jgi:protein-S-isoprenylcysteine O-methyltransferase Ste14